MHWDRTTVCNISWQYLLTVSCSTRVQCTQLITGAESRETKTGAHTARVLVYIDMYTPLTHSHHAAIQQIKSEANHSKQSTAVLMRKALGLVQHNVFIKDMWNISVIHVNEWIKLQTITDSDRKTIESIKQSFSNQMQGCVVGLLTAYQ